MIEIKILDGNPQNLGKYPLKDDNYNDMSLVGNHGQGYSSQDKEGSKVGNREGFKVENEEKDYFIISYNKKYKLSQGGFSFTFDYKGLPPDKSEVLISQFDPEGQLGIQFSAKILLSMAILLQNS